MAEEYLAGSDGPFRMELKRAAISASTSGSGNNVVAAVNTKKIRVVSYDFVVAGAVNVKFQSGGSTDLTGLYTFGAAGDGKVNNFNPVGWMETVAGEALTLNLSGAVLVGGCIQYMEC